MAEKHFCGDCDREFKPEPIYYTGHDLCPECREKRSRAVAEAKEAYDQMNATDRREIDFGSAISDNIPSRRTVLVCNECDREISDGYLCSSCRSRIEAQNEEAARRDEEARQEFERRIRRI